MKRKIFNLLLVALIMTISSSLSNAQVGTDHKSNVDSLATLIESRVGSGEWEGLVEQSRRDPNNFNWKGRLPNGSIIRLAYLGNIKKFDIQINPSQEIANRFDIRLRPFLYLDENKKATDERRPRDPHTPPTYNIFDIIWAEVDQCGITNPFTLSSIK